MYERESRRYESVFRKARAELSSARPTSAAEVARLCLSDLPEARIDRLIC